MLPLPSSSAWLFYMIQLFYMMQYIKNLNDFLSTSIWGAGYIPIFVPTQVNLATISSWIKLKHIDRIAIPEKGENAPCFI